jgi:hypothetical protein
MYQQATTSPFLSTSHNHNNTQPGSAETLADPYKGKIALARVDAFQEPFASCQVIQQDTPNIRKANQYLEHTENCMNYSFPPIATEWSH